jgi:hypothetical protein
MKQWKGFGGKKNLGLIQVRARYLPGGTGKNQDKPPIR